MITVIPKWSAHEVADWDALLISQEDGSTGLNPATATILNYMPIIGITKLTTENVIDAWCRMTLIESLYGLSIQLPLNDVAGQRRHYFVTQDDVIRHVGIETEGAALKFADFYERVCSGRPPSLVELKATAPYVANGSKTLLESVMTRLTTTANANHHPST